MLPAEQAAPLKLLEKGVSKEALAGLVLLEFPCELASAVLAGRWASSPTPFAPFMLGYKIRLVMAAAVTLVVSPCSLNCLTAGFACFVARAVLPKEPLSCLPSGASALTSHPRSPSCC